MNEYERNKLVLFSVDKFEIFFNYEEYSDFKINPNNKISLSNSMGYLFLYIISNSDCIINTLNNTINTLVKPNKKLDNADVFLTNEFRDLNNDFKTLIIMDINNELANQKPSHIKDNLITALEKIINLLQDSKKFIELYLVPQFCNAKNNKRKIAKNYMGFDFQTSKLLSFSIPKSEKIFCRIKNKPFHKTQCSSSVRFSTRI